MTAQEQQMLQGLIDRVRTTQLPDKDPEAEGLLQSSLGSNPDAIYILAQTVLVQQYALSQAQNQLAALRAQNEQLRQQPAAPAKHTSFLDSLLGRDQESPRPAPPPPPQPQPSAASPAYAPIPSYPGVPGSAPASGQWGQQPTGYSAPGGGFLRSALQTATGVAAGALAFQGVESLLHGFGHAAGYGTEFAPMGSSFGAAAPHEEVVNNYYGDSAPGGTSSEHTGSFLPDLNQSTASSGTNNDIWSTPADASATAQQDDLWNTPNDPSTQNAAFDAPDDSANLADGSDINADDTGSFDDSAQGFDDPSGGSDDSGSGFDDSGSGSDSF